MATSSDAFQAAVSKHRQGQLTEAEELCRQILAADAAHAEALHLSGVIAAQRGDSAAAVEQFQRALNSEPGFVGAMASLAMVLADRGELGEAQQWQSKVVQASPQDADARYVLGTIHQRLHQLDQASVCYREAVRLDPRLSQAHSNLGSVLHAQGRVAEALEAFRAAVRIEPTSAESRFNLALALVDTDAAEAEAQLSQVLERRPDYEPALLYYGSRLRKAGRFEQAIDYYTQALRRNPSLVSALANRASVLLRLGRHREAIASFRETIRLKPDLWDAYYRLAVLYNTLDERDAAVEICQQGLAGAPNSGHLYSAMANALQHQGRIVESVAAHRKSVELLPQEAGAESNLLYLQSFQQGIDPAQLFDDHLSWSSRHAESLTAAAHLPPRQRGERRLRIGYVSSHFRNHAVNFFAEPILRSHDPQRFELFCYGDVADGGDEVTARLRSYADTWRDISGLSDEAAARLIREDQIDILVDLAGHIGGNRLLVFARRPAPIQVTYLGYQNTTGMTAMDYRLTDAWADPPGQTERYYTEQLVRLPRAFFCYQPMDSAPDVTPLPSLSRGYITFGSFNNYTKVSPQAVDAWLTILSRVPDSRLLVLANRGGYVEQRWQELAQARGIEPARIEVCDKRPYREYTQLIAQADIALDPFPFNGHTTTCDAIWMGVPVVMLQGPVYAQRFGASVHRNVGLEDWIATSVDEYIDKAVYFASQREELARLRIQLRPRMAASPLLDYAGFTRNLEAAYTTMWQRYREGVPRGTTWPT